MLAADLPLVHNGSRAAATRKKSGKLALLYRILLPRWLDLLTSLPPFLNTAELVW